MLTYNTSKSSDKSNNILFIGGIIGGLLLFLLIYIVVKGNNRKTPEDEYKPKDNEEKKHKSDDNEQKLREAEKHRKDLESKYIEIEQKLNKDNEKRRREAEEQRRKDDEDRRRREYIENNKRIEKDSITKAAFREEVKKIFDKMDSDHEMLQELLKLKNKSDLSEEDKNKIIDDLAWYKDTQKSNKHHDTQIAKIKELFQKNNEQYEKRKEERDTLKAKSSNIKLILNLEELQYKLKNNIYNVNKWITGKISFEDFNASYVYQNQGILLQEEILKIYNKEKDKISKLTPIKSISIEPEIEKQYKLLSPEDKLLLDNYKQEKDPNDYNIFNSNLLIETNTLLFNKIIKNIETIIYYISDANIKEELKSIKQSAEENLKSIL